MSSRAPALIWRSLAWDLTPWLGLSSLFLWIYIAHFDAPTTSAWAHLKVVFGLWLGLACLKALLWRWWPNSRVSRALVSLMAAAALGLLLGYYLLAYVGLGSWGRVITWPLASAYASQAGDVVNSLGYPLFVPLTLLALAFALLLACTHRWMSGQAWARWAIQHASARIAWPSAALLATLLLVEFMLLPPVSKREPLSLSFFATSARMQSHARAGAHIDTAEAGARSGYSPVTLDAPPNVILIVGDALRASHLPSYGYPRASTPRLDALLARESSRRMERVRAVCAESACGLLALASSRPVHELPARPFTLQEVLRKHGYTVRMLLSGDHTNFYGLREAYGEVDEYFDGQMQSRYYMNDDRLLLEHVRALPENNPGKAVMLQFHLMSSHGLGKRQPHSNLYQPFRNYYGKFVRSTRVTPTVRQEVVNYYDNGIVQFDEILAQLLEGLSAKGYLRNALVVITGDHGEMLGEHGMLAHARGTYEGVLDIPLLFIRFGAPLSDMPERTITSQIDIAPTILEELGISSPSTWRGIPLQQRRSHSLIHFQQGSLTGLYDMRDPDHLWKYWRDWDSHHESVYDLSTDPQEARNLVRTTPEQQRLAWRKAVMGGAAAAGLSGRAH